MVVCYANEAVVLGNLTNADAWAIALSEDGQYLAGVSQDGHVRVWDLNDNAIQIRDHETKGSFGTCIDLVSEPCAQKTPPYQDEKLTYLLLQSPDGKFIASGHENGAVYIFKTEDGRMPFSLSGEYIMHLCSAALLSLQI